MAAFRDHADASVQQPYEVSHLSKRVVMESRRLVDPLVAGRLVGDICEQLLQARLCRETSSPMESEGPLDPQRIGFLCPQGVMQPRPTWTRNLEIGSCRSPKKLSILSSCPNSFTAVGWLAKLAMSI